jgi:hypothetical protein
MMVNCRSNDVFWGCYGANAVHFSVLLEYLAGATGTKVGRYWQNSFNFHAYTDKFPEAKFMDYARDIREHNLYETKELKPQPLMVGPREMFDVELRDFMLWSEGAPGKAPPFDEPFLADTAVPMRLAHVAYKEKDFAAADTICNMIDAPDWRAACKMWINRRWERHARKDQTNVG